MCSKKTIFLIIKTLLLIHRCFISKMVIATWSIDYSYSFLEYINLFMEKIYEIYNHSYKVLL